MSYKNCQVVMGKYGRPKKRKGLRIKFRFSRKMFYLALIGMTLGGIFYFLFISDRFEVKEVKISGLEAMNEGKVMAAINTTLSSKKFWLLKSKNYFVFSADKLRAHILLSFPKIASVNVERTLKNLDIKIEEREVIGVWCQKGDCFYFDKEGVIFEEAPKSSGALMIAIEDERDIEKKLGSNVLSGEQISFVRQAHGLMGRNFPFSVQKFLIRDNSDFEILTSENWRILLSKNESPEYQLSNLKYVLDEEIKTRRKELEYVDLRLGNKVYYKWIED